VRIPSGLRPLRERNFALYWAGFAASNTGRWIELTGCVWLAYELTRSPALLGLLGIARALPSFILSPIAGVVADRVDLRKTLLLTQGLALLASISIALLISFGFVQAWHIYLFVAIQAALAAFDAAVRQALFPQLVPTGQIAEAVTLSTTAGRFSKLLGPAIGGIAIASIGPAAPFYLNAATFLALMAAVAAMGGLVARTPGIRSSFRGDLVEGLRHIVRAPVLSGLVMLELAYGLFAMNPVMITIVGREVLGVGPEGLGGLLSAPALGSIFGIGWLLIFGHRSRFGRFSLMCTFGYAAALVALALARDYVVCFGILAIVGLLDVLVTITRNSVLQLAAPPEMRGRVMANVGIVTRGIGPVAETQSGLVTSLLGPSLAIVAAAIALASTAAAVARRNEALWLLSVGRGGIVEVDLGGSEAELAEASPVISGTRAIGASREAVSRLEDVN
jgi:MFS family permease